MKGEFWLLNKLVEMEMNNFKYVRQRHLRKKTKKLKGGTKYVWSPNRNVLLFERRWQSKEKKNVFNKAEPHIMPPSPYVLLATFCNFVGLILNQIFETALNYRKVLLACQWNAAWEHAIQERRRVCSSPALKDQCVKLYIKEYLLANI